MVKFNPPWFRTGIVHYTDNSSDSSSEKDEQETFLGVEKQLNPPTKPTVFSRLCSWAWVFSTFALIFITMLLSLKLRRQLAIDALRTYEIGFDTDLKPAWGSIELQKVRFTGGLKVTENGTLYRPVDPNEPQYVGEPGPEIDQAWADLLYAPEVGLYGKDAERLVGVTYQMPESGAYRSGLDVFHTLHCVNEVRKELDNWYYDFNTHQEPKHIRRMHIDHCIDYLRQSVMCSADMTPATLFWSEANQRVYNSFTTVHTCRNFEKLHDWSKKHFCGADCP